MKYFTLGFILSQNGSDIQQLWNGLVLFEKDGYIRLFYLTALKSPSQLGKIHVEIISWPAPALKVTLSQHQEEEVGYTGAKWTYFPVFLKITQPQKDILDIVNDVSEH